MIHERTDCRLCRSRDLSAVLTLPDTPLANEFVTELTPQAVYRLQVMRCSACGHAQLRDVVDPKVLFGNYCYVSGTSPSFVKHFSNYAADLFARSVKRTWTTLDKTLVVDIGGNDGTLLKRFTDYGYRVLNVEPAYEIAVASGVPFFADFFSRTIADQIVEGHGEAHIVTCNNAFAHIDDLDGVVNGVKAMLHPKGIFAIEVQYVKRLLEDGLFDMVYHEHLDYHALAPLVHFFERHGLEVFDAREVPTHGGSIRIYVGWPKAHERTVELERLLLAEMKSDTNKSRAWWDLAERIQAVKHELSSLLDHLYYDRGADVVAYGAPAKLTTLMYTLGVPAKVIDYVVDDSTWKQGKLTPGLHIPVVEPAELYDDEHGYPDYVLVTAWNFSIQIREKHAELTESGTHWITPLPKLEVTP